MTSRQLYAEITKGLIEADIFVEDATGDDLRDILPHNTIAKIDGLLSAKSAGIHKESIMDFDVDDLAPEVAEYIAELEDNVSALSKALEEVVEEEPLDLIEKAFAENPELAEVIKADRERLAKAESELEEARIEKANSIWVSKAQSLPAIVEQPSEFGAALRKLNDAFPDEVATIVSALELANSRVEKSLFAEYGSGGRNNVSDALAQATSIAKSIQEANPDLSLEEARARAWETNPELYEQYVQDSRSNK